MAGSGCREKIEASLSYLTETEKKLASHVLEHYDEILNQSVSELARRANVSDASVVRFCRSIGYRGFTDLKINMAKDLVPRERSLNPVLEEGDDPATIIRKVFASEISVLDRTLQQMDPGVIMEIAERIYAAKKLVVFGTGGSSIVARDIQHKFLKIGITALVFDDVDLQLMNSALLDKDDVAIAVSFSGSNVNTVNCLKNAKKAGAYCVGVVSQRKSPLSRLADRTVYAAYDETIFQSESVSTRIAQLAILDAIVSCTAFCNYNRFSAAIEKTRASTAENKY